jgi:glycosyltransferase involved in cell wall biosynthesis
VIKILCVVRPAAGGIRQHVIELIERTDPHRVSMIVAGPRDFLKSLPAETPLAGQVLVDIAPRLSPASDLLAAARLAQYLSSHGPMLVHAHSLRAAFVAALARRLRSFPFVFTAHNLVRQGTVARLGIQFTASQAIRVIAISQAVAEGLAFHGVPKKKISVIPNGVDVEWFTPQPPILGETEKKFTVGCVGRLSREKGIDVLLQAASQMHDTQFIIAGDGPERAALQKLAPPNATLLGRINDPRTLYASADVITVPSREEGQGIVALEAMASGVPIVASRVGGLAEMLTDGATALLIPADDTKALTESLTRLRDDLALRAHLAINGRALVEDKYDVRRMIEAMQSVYAEMAP